MFQLIHAIPKSWKLAILNDNGNCKIIIYLNHHLIKNYQILAIKYNIPKELCSLSIALKNVIPTSQRYFSNISPRLSGNRFISYHVKFQLPPIYICSHIKYWTILYLNKQLCTQMLNVALHILLAFLCAQVVNITLSVLLALFPTKVTNVALPILLALLCPKRVNGISSIDNCFVQK